MTAALRQSCLDSQALQASSRIAAALPDVSNTMKAAQKLGAAGMGLDHRPNAPSMNEIAAAIDATLAAGGTLSKRELRKSVWCLWKTSPALSENPQAFAAILEAVNVSPKRNFFRNLAAVYLVEFDPEQKGFSEVSGILQRLALRWGDPWASHQREYSLYDSVAGPRKVAGAAVEQNQSATKILQELGLGALNAQSGFAEAITREILVDLANGAEPNPEYRLARVQNCAMNERGELLFNTLDFEIAEALMKPFLEEPPEKRIKDMFLNLMLSIFLDPRISPARWDRFPRIKALVIAWLTEQSLRQFLDIVSRTTVNSADAAMWRFRRAFWEAAYRRDLIRGAWVVFAEEGAILARRSFGKQTQFATFNGYGGKQVQRTHAVLLLEIGNGIIADWSHNGKVNIWNDAQDRTAPRLYKRHYSSDDVQISTGRSDIIDRDYLVKTHSSPHTYSWQRVVAQRLYEMTNVRIQEHEYRA